MKRRRPVVVSFSSAIMVVLVAFAWVLLAPPQLGGQTSYVIVNGNSMEPGMHRGDLAIVREANDYQVGDVVTYRHPQIGPVIHRIIARDGARYVFQGDHNDFIDSYHPTDQELVGRLWLHVPSVGSWLARFHSPWYMAGLLCLAFMGFGGVSAIKGSGSPPPGRAGRPQPSSSQPSRGGTPMQQLLRNWQDTLSVLAAAGIALLGMAWVSFHRPTHHDVPANIPYTQSGQFAYSAPAADGRVYDTGEATSGEPVYRRLSQEVAFQFTYALKSDPQAAASGTYRMVAELGDRNGWKRTIELTPETSFSGQSFVAGGLLDLSQVQSLIAILEEQSGVKNERYSVVIRPEVSIAGSIKGTAFNDTFTPSLPMAIDAVQLRMDAPAQNETPLAPSTDGNVGTLVSQANSLKLLVISLPVSLARTVSLAGLGIVAGVCGWLLIAFVQQRKAQPKGIGASGTRLRSPLVNVRGTVPTPRTRVIDVASLEDLGRIAARIGGVVLQEARPGYHAFFVHDMEITYRYEAVTAPSPAAETPDSRRIA
ncbi:MAG: signal peptidase I [Dehalococcoidia bacterium]|jgi:signal peptidase I